MTALMNYRRPASLLPTMTQLVRGLLFWALACACGGSEAAPAQAPSTSPRSPGDLAGATVYDANGDAKACEPPKPDCPRDASSLEFRDKCRLEGYQLRRCGCETVCSGNVMAPKMHYDAEGNAKECAPEEAECTPPDTTAAFQDACGEAHHRLVVCGCEWLCDGEPK